ncbi:MAG: hypothetical protein JEY79_07295 [Pseudodesulfovibrio sp.]|nr:hypothetical protein [Pseudodesulfovibrio sp.]
MDRILSASSANGVDWVRDRGVRIDAEGSESRDMIYFNHVITIPDGFRMYYHASFFRDGVWAGNVFSATSKDGLRWKTGCRLQLRGENDDVVRHVQSPTIVELDDGHWRMYYVAEGAGGERTVQSARSDNGKDWVVESGVRVDRFFFNGVDSLSDCSVQIFGDGFRLYLSVSQGVQTSIMSAFSSDGLNWEAEQGERISAGVLGRTLIANNPCVIPVNGEWWMYFRGGDKLAVENCIYLAKSLDGLDWQIECRVLGPRPKSLYDCHAVAFPFVLQLPNGSFKMYYSGFWGKHFNSQRIVNQWEAATAQAYKKRSSVQ